eukprot:gnl/TRDRNA2_/TRDRNA2_185646_c0_seq1.p1 gnl/TRDRNA2_/TRDRNA2_185646_c0~~gnl/TRDRNA2_/TRDRNA2_185646_c0_seq1.p1  ORF type:complete len:200 (+),score=33.76 gnl/TRDRNA2_/TRDRNA2_185646_c0_seq1:74-673(+)
MVLFVVGSLAFLVAANAAPADSKKSSTSASQAWASYVPQSYQTYLGGPNSTQHGYGAGNEGPTWPKGVPHDLKLCMDVKSVCAWRSAKEKQETYYIPMGNSNYAMQGTESQCNDYLSIVGDIWHTSAANCTVLCKEFALKDEIAKEQAAASALAATLSRPMASWLIMMPCMLVGAALALWVRRRRSAAAEEPLKYVLIA